MKRSFIVMALSHILVMLISQHSLPSQIMEGTIFDIVYLQKYFSPRMSNEEVLFPPPDNLQHQALWRSNKT